MISDPFPKSQYEYQNPEERTGVEVLIRLYEQLRRTKSAGAHYRLPRDKKVMKAFTRLYHLLKQNSITGADYMTFVESRYSIPFPNTVTGAATMRAYLAQGKPVVRWETLAGEIAILDRMGGRSIVPSSNYSAFVEFAQSQVSPLTFFFYLSQRRIPLSLKQVDEACRVWLFSNEDLRMKLVACFPNAKMILLQEAEEELMNDDC